ncbi:Glycerol kinase, partial [Ascosphaera atra]
MSFSMSNRQRPSWSSSRRTSTNQSPRGSFNKSLALLRSMRDLLFSRESLQPVDEAVIDNHDDEGNDVAVGDESDEEEQQGDRPVPLRRAVTSGSTKSGKKTEAAEEKKKPRKLIGAIDQGTTSSRFIIFDETGNPVAKHQVELSRIHEQPGWHEQDPEEIVGSVNKCINQACKTLTMRGFSTDDVVTVGMTSQRETTLVWDWETGKPLHNSIAWPDTRVAPLVREFKEKEGADEVATSCG